MVVADEASRCAMEAADGSKEERIVVMPTAIPNPLETGGFEAECWYYGKRGHKESEC